MKQLILVRHSKAENHSEDGSDFKRNLKKKGILESKEMAHKFTDHKLSVDLIISSPAHRALQTAKVFARILKYPEKNIQQEHQIYEAISFQSFLNILYGCSDKHNTVIMFGHEPTISGFANFLIKNFNYRFPKTAILAIRFDMKSWKEIKGLDGKNLFFLLPGNKNKDEYLYY